ncbi:hypothetical protein scyTo_0026320, partial [Scyliorhinus torazame]|nr:hypothetical protein [Scyliorhinus torazame]
MPCPGGVGTEPCPGEFVMEPCPGEVGTELCLGEVGMEPCLGEVGMELCPGKTKLDQDGQGLKPEKLNLEARTPEAKENVKYRLWCFEAYLDSAEIPILGPRKLSLLHGRVSHRISATLEKATTYEEAVELLRKRFVKPIN